MHNQERPAQREGLEDRYFEFLAGMGITKHMGSIHSTEALIAACHIDAGQRVLDVGCGVGITPCLLAGKYGCRVVGVDITPGMITKANKRARQEGVADRTEFTIAAAQNLPFAAASFDVVILESVMVFLMDKTRAIQACTRVVRQGGYVGLNEMTLLQESTLPRLTAYFEQTTGIRGTPPTATTWRTLLEKAGLKDVVAQGHQVHIRDEVQGRLRRFRPRDYIEGMWWILRKTISDPKTRGIFGQIMSGSKMLSRDMFAYLGYGICVGRKS